MTPTSVPRRSLARLPALGAIIGATMLATVIACSRKATSRSPDSLSARTASGTREGFGLLR